MTITNLGALQSALEDWVEETVADALFVEMAANVTDALERGIMGPDGRVWISPPIRSRLMIATTTLSPASASVALPADWLETVRLWINANDGRDLLYVPVNQFWSGADAQQTGTPLKYTIDDQNIKLQPTTDVSLQMTYYQMLTDLVVDADTNVILTAHPRIYLNGCLSEYWDRKGGMESQSDRYRMRMAGMVRAVNAERAAAQSSGSLLVMRPGSVA